MLVVVCLDMLIKASIPEELIYRRKYFFSLSPDRLYTHLLMREVPVVPPIYEHKDYVSNLYDRLDDYNSNGRDWRLTERLVWRYVTYIKNRWKTFISKESGLKMGKFRKPMYFIYVYYSKSVIEQYYEPEIIDGIEIPFNFRFYPNLFEFLKTKLESGVAIGEDPHLLWLSDYISFDVKYLKYVINKQTHGRNLNNIKTNERS